MVNDMAQSLTRIYVALDSRKEDHQASVIEMEGMVTNQTILIMIGLIFYFIYNSLRVMEKNSLQNKNHGKIVVGPVGHRSQK